jgi:hypothetical protein
MTEGFSWLEPGGRTRLCIEYPGPPDWETIGPTDKVKELLADGVQLGPKPAGQDFARLRTLSATWSRDIASWLRGSDLWHLVIDRATQATLDALDGVPLKSLRLQDSRFAGPLRWPRLEGLDELWCILGKDVDLAGAAAALPKLRSVRIVGVKRLSHLGELGVEHRLRDVHLEEIRDVDDPAQLWQINADRVVVDGTPVTTPWVVEALRALTAEQEQALTTSYWFPNDSLVAAAGSEDSSSPGTVSEVNDEDEERPFLSFQAFALPTGHVLEGQGVESSGDVWADLVTRLWPDLAGRLELDPDGDAFFAAGPVDHLRTLQTKLEPLLTDPEALARALHDIPLDQMGL